MYFALFDLHNGIILCKIIVFISRTLSRLSLCKPQNLRIIVRKLILNRINFTR